MCDCQNKIRESYIAENPDITHFIFGLSNIKAVKEPNAKPKTGQPVEIGFNTVKKGKPAHKWIKTFIAHEYCPFCGVKYE